MSPRLGDRKPHAGHRGLTTTNACCQTVSSIDTPTREHPSAWQKSAPPVPLDQEHFNAIITVTQQQDGRRSP
jgi:hypothetical protein